MRFNNEILQKYFPLFEHFYIDIYANKRSLFRKEQNMILDTLDILSIVIDFALLIWFAYTYRRTLGTRSNKYMKILIVAVVLSLVNKIFLGGSIFVSVVEVGLIVYVIYQFNKERNRYY